MVDNANSLLDVSDLVFIDMPGTGFGRLTGKDAEKAFWGIDEDANAFARFIARFITKYNRWNSPKYIFGESYGTTRSAVLADILENEQEHRPERRDSAFADLQLYHRHRFSDRQSGSRSAVRAGAAHVCGDGLVPQEAAATTAGARAISERGGGVHQWARTRTRWRWVRTWARRKSSKWPRKLHEYTGLPVAYLLKANLRVSGGEFEKTLQDDQDITTGRLDTRFSGPTLDPLSEQAEYDPQSSAISSAYVSLFNDYVRRDLKYGEGQTYLPEALSGINQWDFKHRGNPVSVNVAPDLAEAMKTNPRLKVMVNGGYYDLATPFFAAQYEEKHLPIPQSLAKNIEYDWYESGHMVYVRDESLKQLHDRVAAFITNTDAGGK